MSTTVLKIVPGETGNWLINISDAADAAQSLASLTNAWMTVKQKLSDAEPGVFQLTLGAGLTIVDASAGTLRATASPAQTMLLAGLRKARWDVRLKFADGTVSNPEGLINGELIVDPAVTLSN